MRTARSHGPTDQYGHAVLVEGDRIMGAAEVRDRLGIGRTRLVELMRRASFPQPIKKLSAGYIWDGDEIEQWIAEHRPPPDELEV